MPRILVIEDERILAKNICDALNLGGHEAESATTGEEGLERVGEFAPDLILLDLRLPRMDGLEVLRTLRSRKISTPVIVVSAHGSIDAAVEAMKNQASDFLTKPLDLTALQMVVNRVLEHQRVVERLDYFRSRERADSGIGSILGTSSSIESVRQLIKRLVRTPAMASAYPPSVLILGETGTGKDLVARAIHYEGPRADNAFVRMNCTAVPDELFEAELFGHVKGAFTDARTSKKGLMEVADGGTLFLDEIGHMKLALQAKLLTSIEQKMIRPVGATSERPVNIHVIAATNRNLEQAIEAGEFRVDFYHRLRVITIEPAPLRERVEDVDVLAAHFLRLYGSRFGTRPKRISDEGMALLRAHRWPGNVRELSHAIESAVLMCDDDTLGPEHFQVPLGRPGSTLEMELPGGRSLVVDFEAGHPTLDEIENTILQAALEYTNHNASRAARILGLTREAVRYRLEKHKARRQADSS